MPTSEFIKLFRTLGQLKNVSRSGWGRCGIQEPESVADHSFRTTIITMIMSDYLKLNTEKAIRLALLHDIAEAVIGDITPYDKLTSEEKRRKEYETIKELLKGIPYGDNYINLWEEFDNIHSAEARLVKNIDKFEMVLQAVEYQKQFPNLDMNEFAEDAEKQININEVRELFNIIRK